MKINIEQKVLGSALKERGDSTLLYTNGMNDSISRIMYDFEGDKMSDAYSSLCVFMGNGGMTAVHYQPKATPFVGYNRNYDMRVLYYVPIHDFEKIGCRMDVLLPAFNKMHDYDKSVGRINAATDVNEKTALITKDDNLRKLYDTFLTAFREEKKVYVKLGSEEQLKKGDLIKSKRLQTILAAASYLPELLRKAFSLAYSVECVTSIKRHEQHFFLIAYHGETNQWANIGNGIQVDWTGPDVIVNTAISAVKPADFTKVCEDFNKKLKEEFPTFECIAQCMSGFYEKVDKLLSNPNPDADTCKKLAKIFKEGNEHSYRHEEIGVYLLLRLIDRINVPNLTFSELYELYGNKEDVRKYIKNEINHAKSLDILNFLYDVLKEDYGKEIQNKVLKDPSLTEACLETKRATSLEVAVINVPEAKDIYLKSTLKSKKFAQIAHKIVFENDHDYHLGLLAVDLLKQYHQNDLDYIKNAINICKKYYKSSGFLIRNKVEDAFIELLIERPAKTLSDYANLLYGFGQLTYFSKKIKLDKITEIGDPEAVKKCIKQKDKFDNAIKGLIDELDKKFKFLNTQQKNAEEKYNAEKEKDGNLKKITSAEADMKNDKAENAVPKSAEDEADTKSDESTNKKNEIGKWICENRRILMEFVCAFLISTVFFSIGKDSVNNICDSSAPQKNSVTYIIYSIDTLKITPAKLLHICLPTFTDSSITVTFRCDSTKYTLQNLESIDNVLYKIFYSNSSTNNEDKYISARFVLTKDGAIKKDTITVDDRNNLIKQFVSDTLRTEMYVDKVIVNDSTMCSLPNKTEFLGMKKLGSVEYLYWLIEKLEAWRKENNIKGNIPF